MLDDLDHRIADRKRSLDDLRPLHGGALAQLRAYYDVELTYTSNAIEGNTLTYRETAEVIEHGITVGGKSIRDHLEALDHHDAVRWMRDLAAQTTPLGELTVTELHRRIVARSQPEIAGHYSQHRRRIAGSQAMFPNPAKVPASMAELGTRIFAAPATYRAAFDAHYALTAIHPFGDGNGRTARLLMNLMLIRGGYPPIAVRLEDRPTYLTALETASLTGDTASLHTLLAERLLTTLDDYVAALSETMTR